MAKDRRVIFEAGRIGRGDFVEATEQTGFVPIGTVGQVVGVVHAPGLPRSVHVEWSLRKWPYVKKEWHHETEVQRLKEDT